MGYMNLIVTTALTLLVLSIASLTTEAACPDQIGKRIDSITRAGRAEHDRRRDLLEMYPDRGMLFYMDGILPGSFR